MGSYTRGLELADAIIAAGLYATVDPRSAAPPCALIAPPALAYDLNCPGGTATWQIFALATSPASADTWVVLDDMAEKISSVLPVQRHDYVSYSLSPDAPPLPAYRLTFTQGVEF